ncbi:hypothetical protein T310_9413, partial [Rasamsonia emersonii CBS 393.64]
CILRFNLCNKKKEKKRKEKKNWKSYFRPAVNPTARPIIKAMIITTPAIIPPTRSRRFRRSFANGSLVSMTSLNFLKLVTANGQANFDFRASLELERAASHSSVGPFSWSTGAAASGGAVACCDTVASGGDAPSGEATASGDPAGAGAGEATGTGFRLGTVEVGYRGGD